MADPTYDITYLHALYADNTLFIDYIHQSMMPSNR